MKFIARSWIQAAFLLGPLGAASAADLPDPIYVPTPIEWQAPSWAGHYVGIHGLYGDASYTSTGFPGETFHADGFMGGGQIGYNWQHGQTVYGIEASASFGSISRDGVTFDDTVPWLGMLRGRIGYSFDHALFRGAGAAADPLLVYATGGFAAAGIESTGPAGSDTATGTGWTLGVGLEKQVWNHHSLTLEYSYVDFRPATLSAGGTSEVDASAHVFRVGLNFRNLWH